MYELLVKNATIVDGTGAAAYLGSVASVDGKLQVLPADCKEEAEVVIDGTGLMVTPGFIDPHSHGDVPLGKKFASLSKISQGITTHVAGQCGFSMSPINPKTLDLMKQGMSIFTEDFPEEMETFTTFENYLKYANKLEIPENVKFLVGHVSLRIAAMGFDNRKPTKEEMEHMKSMLREAMEHGAMGLCSGLIYIPSVYGDIEELAELCTVLPEFDGVYTTHMRNESFFLLDSINETIQVAKGAGCRAHISHLKVCGQPNWGMSKDALEMIHAAQAEGVKITADQYPYTATMTHLNATVPPKYFTKGIPGMVEALEDPETRAIIKAEILDPETPFENQYICCNGFDNIFVASASATPEYEGATVGESAKKFGKDEFDMFFEILIKNKGVASAIYFCLDEKDVFDIIKDDSVMVGTDGIVKTADQNAHPRAYGTFPRALNYFVKENNVMPLEEMVRKMTGFIADKMMIYTKGIIKDGMDADLVVLNYETVKDTATFANSNQLADGIEYVIVGGQVVYKDKQLTGATPGKIILHEGAKA